MLRAKFGDPKYAPLDQLWSSADTYVDLAASAADGAEYFKDQKYHEVERLFWSQFHVPVRPLLLNERMAEWAELHRLSMLATRSVVDHLWPEGPRPNSYFSLVQQFLGVVPHIDAMKRSACIEGARMAFARVKIYWAVMEATTIAHRVRPWSKWPPSTTLKKFEGARSIEAQCSKNVMF